MTAAHDILAGLERHGIRLGLDHLRALAAELGSPERAIPAVIVAGTNGKGSVASFLASIAGVAGHRVGLYTSPHLENPEERIRVAGTSVPPDALADLLREVIATAARLGHASPTYFEAMTLAAFLHFAREGCALSVLEVGMGGRLDATNLADAQLAVIAAIALDHQEFLGSTLDAIAREKAGVLRARRPAIVSPQAPEALAALLAEAAGRDTSVCEVSHEVVALDVEFRGLAGLRLRLATQRQSYDLETPLAGRHQAWNVATAVVAAERFEEASLPPLDRAAIVAGVAACRWPGRLESIELAGEDTAILLDAAHNPDGCAALVAFLVELDRPFTLLFGALADKDVAQMLPDLAALAHRVVLTRPASPRAADPAALAALVQPGLPVDIEPDIDAALARALAHPSGLVVACGSIFLIGALRARLARANGRPLP